MAEPTVGPYGTSPIDNFNQVDGAVSSIWTGVLRTGDVAFTISSGEIISSAADASMYYNGASPGPNCEAWAQAINGTDLKLYARVTATGSETGYYVTVNPNGSYWDIGKSVTGTHTVLKTAAAREFFNGDWFAIACNGSSIELWRWPDGGNAWDKIDSITDTSITAAGRIGIQGAASTVIDDFGGGTIGSVATTEVPSRYDVIINGEGYMLLDSIETSLPYGSHRAKYGFSPTFVQRSNVQGDFGDNQQDFYLTWTQRDWSLGENQRYFRPDDDRARRFWLGSNVDINTIGEVALAAGLCTSSAGSSYTTLAAWAPPFGHDATVQNANRIYWADTTNLYYTDDQANVTDLGAHGLGAAPTTMSGDQHELYLSTTAAGTVGVRKCVVSGPTYTTWSTTDVDVLHYHNNSLYGVDDQHGTLLRYLSGNPSSGVDELAYWVQADGGPTSNAASALATYGGKLLILRMGAGPGTQLWLYDGTGTYLINEFPPNFYGRTMQVLDGVIFVGGAYLSRVGTATTPTVYKPAILYYANGTPGMLWESNSVYTSDVGTIPYNAAWLSMQIFDGRLVWWNADTSSVSSYDPVKGGYTNIIALATKNEIWAGHSFLLLNGGGTTSYTYSLDKVTTSSGYVISSLFDFNSSLRKNFRSIRIDADIPAGATIDIAYLVDDLAGTYTTLQSTALAGVDYTLTGIAGRAISVKITLNKGSSTTGPVLRRVLVKAAPVLEQYRRCEYILNCAGVEGKSPVILRDGMPHPKTGGEMVDNLITAIEATSPISVTDRLGTYTAIIEPDGTEILEIHPGKGAYIVKVTTRET